MTVTMRCKALGSSIRVAILDMLRDDSPMTAQEVADNFLWSPKEVVSIRRHLQKLCDAKLCERVEIGRKFYYTICTHAGEELGRDLEKLFKSTKGK